jgi:hypothetical protein
MSERTCKCGRMFEPAFLWVRHCPVCVRRYMSGKVDEKEPDQEKLF